MIATETARTEATEATATTRTIASGTEEIGTETETETETGTGRGTGPTTERRSPSVCTFEESAPAHSTSRRVSCLVCRVRFHPSYVPPFALQAGRGQGNLHEVR